LSISFEKIKFREVIENAVHSESILAKLAILSVIEGEDSSILQGVEREITNHLKQQLKHTSSTNILVNSNNYGEEKSSNAQIKRLEDQERGDDKQKSRFFSFNSLSNLFSSRGKKVSPYAPSPTGVSFNSSMNSSMNSSLAIFTPIHPIDAPIMFMQLESVIESIISPLIIVKKDRAVLLVNDAFISKFSLGHSNHILGRDSYNISPCLLVKGDYSETVMHLNNQQFIVSMNVRGLKTKEAGEVFISNIHSTESSHPGQFTFRESKMLETLDEKGVGTCFVDSEGVVSTHTPGILNLLETSANDLVGTTFDKYFISHGNRKLNSVVKSPMPQTLDLSVDVSNDFSQDKITLTCTTVPLPHPYNCHMLFLSRKDVVSREPKNQGYSMDELIQYLYHELKNPINSAVLLISEYCDARGIELNKKAVLALNRIEKLLLYMNSLIDSVASFENIKSGNVDLEMVPFTPLHFMMDCIDSTEKKGRSVSLMIEEALINTRLVGNETGLLQSVIHILSNACAHSPLNKGVEFEMKYARDQYDEFGEYEEEEYKQKDGAVFKRHVEIIVRDKGEGIPPIILEYLDKPYSFKRLGTDFERDGAGFGLRITKKLIEAHGGTILFERDEYDGTTIVKIYLKMMVELMKEVDYDETKVINGKYVDRYLGSPLLGRKAKTFTGDIVSQSTSDLYNFSSTFDEDFESKSTKSSVGLFSLGNASSKSSKSSKSSSDSKSSSRGSSSEKKSVVQESLDAYLRAELGVVSQNTPKTPGSYLISDSTRPGENEQKITNSQKVSSPNERENWILVVEDDSLSRKVLRRLFQREGYQVDSAENGQVAVKMVEESKLHGKKYTLITMDKEMPVMDGYEATEIINSMGMNIPIIGVTANTTQGQIEEFKSHGVVEVFPKPITRNIVKSLIHFYLRGGD